MMQIVEGDLVRAVDLDALFRAESDGVYRTLFAFTGGRADIAEEATAEAFARALAQGEPLRDPLAWIYRVAFRVAIDEVRRERRRAPEAEALVAPPELVGLIGALRRLTPNQRAAVVLRHVGDLDVDEVAKRIGCSRATVRVHLYRARSRLRELLAEEKGTMERWERELERLRNVEAPGAKLRTRVDDGPQGDGMPPTPGRGQRIAAAIVAFAVFGGALALAGGALDGDETSPPLGTAGPEAVLLLSATADGPGASLTYEGESAAVQVVSYCWSGDGVGICVDTVMPEPFSAEDFLVIPAGTRLAIETTGDLEDLGLRLIEGSDPMEDGRRLTVEEFSAIEPGQYVLETRATWADQIEPITHYLALEIAPSGVPSLTEEPSPTANGLAATLDAPDGGSAPSMTLAYRGVESPEYFGGGTWLGEEIGVLSMLQWFEPHLSPGAPFSVAGDATEVEATITAQYPDGRWEQEGTVLDLTSGLASLPDDPGTYLLSLTGRWPQGRIGFSVAITIGDPAEPRPSPLPEVTPGIVPDVVGVNEGDAGKLLTQAGFESASEYVPTPGVAGGTVVSMDPPPGTALAPGSTVHLVVSGTTVAFDGYLTPLACSSEDMMPFAHTGGVDEPAGEAYIRVNTEGITPSDELIQVTHVPGDGSGGGLWNLVREGNVLAVIDWRSLEGVACRGSGIAGV